MYAEGSFSGSFCYGETLFRSVFSVKSLSSAVSLPEKLRYRVSWGIRVEKGGGDMLFAVSLTCKLHTVFSISDKNNTYTFHNDSFSSFLSTTKKKLLHNGYTAPPRYNTAGVKTTHYIWRSALEVMPYPTERLGTTCRAQVQLGCNTEY